MSRKTPLFEAHRALGARLVDFAGWEMPVQYTSVIAEHEAVRTAAGLFDVSHMGEVEFRGPGALEAANKLITNDLGRIHDGQAVYAGLLNEAGGFVDDVVAYRFSPERRAIQRRSCGGESEVTARKSGITVNGSTRKKMEVAASSANSSTWVTDAGMCGIRTQT